MDDLNENAPVQRGNAAGGSENHVGAGLGCDCTASHRQTGATLGAELRGQGIALADAAGDPWWRACADTALRYLASVDRPFSSDDLLALIGVPERPNQVGAVFRAAVASGTIRPVGYVLSNRASRHRGVQRLYRGGAGR